MEQKNKIAGFWKRFLSNAIDLIIFIAISSASSLMAVGIRNTKPVIISDINYYLWFIILIITILIFFWLIPFLTKGSTLGMLIFKLQYVSIDHENTSIMKIILNKSKPFSILWIFNVLVVMACINPNLAVKISTNTTLNPLDNTLLTIASVTASAILTLNLFFIISTGVKKDKVGLGDILSHTTVIIKNQFEQIQVIKNEKLLPMKNNNEKITIIWRNTDAKF